MLRPKELLVSGYNASKLEKLKTELMEDPHKKLKKKKYYWTKMTPKYKSN